MGDLGWPVHHGVLPVHCTGWLLPSFLVQRCIPIRHSDRPQECAAVVFRIEISCCTAAHFRHRQCRTVAVLRNGGVTGNCRGQINHAVMAVGYGSDGLDYFKIRNSWGTSWGEEGYVRLAQEGGRQGTACLLQEIPVYPVLSTADVQV